MWVKFWNAKTIWLPDRWNLKLVPAIFCQSFIFWPNDSLLKTMENVFYFILKALFVLEIFNFLYFFPSFPHFHIERDKWKWNNLRWCHELTCINLQISFLEKLKNCFTLNHQTWPDNVWRIKEFFWTCFVSRRAN